jgi:hypothetical protein
VCEKERERERERVTDRQTDRQTDRDTETQTERRLKEREKMRTGTKSLTDRHLCELLLHFGDGVFHLDGHVNVDGLLDLDDVVLVHVAIHLDNLLHGLVDIPHLLRRTWVSFGTTTTSGRKEIFERGSGGEGREERGRGGEGEREREREG